MSDTPRRSTDFFRAIKELQPGDWTRAAIRFAFTLESELEDKEEELAALREVQEEIEEELSHYHADVNEVELNVAAIRKALQRAREINKNDKNTTHTGSC